jgi:conjugal transfer pilus assembly protein TraF
MRAPRHPSSPVVGGRAALRRAARIGIGIVTVAAASVISSAASAESMSTTAARPQASAAAATATTSAAPKTFWRSSRDGWFWYLDPPLPGDDTEADEPRIDPPALPPLPPTPAEQDLARFKSFQAELEAAMNVSIINPSPANVGRFLELWAESRRKAAVFTDVAQATAARMPWVDETSRGVRPPNPLAQRAFDQIRAADTDAQLRALAQTHGLYFFFRGDCPYCHVAAPLLKQFADRYGITVFAISMDGSTLPPHFPTAARDNGIAGRFLAELQIPVEQFQVPFTVLAEPSTRHVLPVGFGVMTEAEITNRLMLLMRALPPQGADTARTGSATAPTTLPTALPPVATTDAAQQPMSPP